MTDPSRYIYTSYLTQWTQSESLILGLMLYASGPHELMLYPYFAGLNFWMHNMEIHCIHEHFETAWNNPKTTPVVRGPEIDSPEKFPASNLLILSTDLCARQMDSMWKFCDLKLSTMKNLSNIKVKENHFSVYVWC